MRVLVVTQQRIPHEGGLSTHVLDLIAGLRRNGDQVRLLHGGQVIPSKLQRLLGMARALGNRDYYRAALLDSVVGRLAQRISAEVSNKPTDVIHCHDPYAGTAVGRLAHKTIPVVETVHGPALYEYRQMANSVKGGYTERLISQCEKAAFRQAWHFIAVDSGQAAILRNDYAVEPERITVIFNSVNVDEVRELAAKPTPKKPPCPYFLVPRRLVPKTGVQYAIEAFAKLPHREVHLVIAGDGPLHQELVRLTARLGVEARVHFLGSLPRPDLMPLFALSLSVLVPSVPVTGVVEATSLAVMEGMACGTPVIASGIGGLAELIEDGRTGLLVPPADADALAQRMIHILDCPDARAALVSAATAKVDDDYSSAAWLSRTRAAYERVLDMQAKSQKQGVSA